jgi:chemotaxis protein histidine kinase CheA
MSGVSPVLMAETTNTEPIEITGNSVTIPLSAAVDVVDGVGNRAVKTAISLPDLVRQTNQFSKKYRGGCAPRLLDSNPKALFLHYNVKCNKEDSDPAGHDVRTQFDVTKVQESQKAKDLDIQVQCSCPAFLYWGAQWNLHQRDGLLGPARPQLQAPKERLDLRGNYVICKHIHAVFERILPSVQHNVVNILRKREVERRKMEVEDNPELLQKQKERGEKKQKLDEARKTKNKEIKQKLLDALRNEEEARMLHEKELDEQVPEEVQRTEPATEPHEAPKKREPEWSKLPKHYQPKEEQELADIESLTDEEEKKIEQLHKENKPHIHKGLPYEAEEGGKKSSKHASASEPGLLWRAPEDNQSHDYQPSWDYEPRENSDPELVKIAIQAATGIYRNTKEPFELWDVDMSHLGAVAMYIDGTCGYPVVFVDLEAHRDYKDQIAKSIYHELKHAVQDSEGREYDENEAEED